MSRTPTAPPEGTALVAPQAKAGAPRGTNPRRVALEILLRVEATDAYANLLLDARLRAASLSLLDRALVTELVYGVLRWRGKLDWILAPLLDRPLARLDPVVHQLLRLGTYQLACLTRIPDFAAVDETVSLARKIGAARSAGYVNAVLRAVVRGKDRQPPDPLRDPLAYWGGVGSHPTWLAARWLDRLGSAEGGELMTANNRVPPLTLAANRLKAEGEEVGRLLAQGGAAVTPGRFFPGIFTLRGAGSLTDFPGFGAGLFFPMDEAGVLPVLALDLLSGQRVLDACAGGGGKSALIAAAVGGTGEVVALDRSPRALRRLTAAALRLGLATVRPTLYDARVSGEAWAGQFPRVLLDAPCSGLGTIRRRPEIKWRRRPSDLAQAAALQRALLTGVARAVADGGLLVYSTCSLEPEETDEVIGAFLDTHPDFALEAPGPALRPFCDPVTEGILRAWPHRHDTDGFFVARLRRTS
ncbi:MAG: 16S rRNA (cytosine(967)-C(5))-methyltransferase RsmB [candidate division NC10 bacterium]